ncbi:ABC transporter ATP-binding protein [candidate division WOR-3 bacterium]|nr:ABC transporter ATP-binding protein [candidate division WOR-3 bacterium]MCK4583874.1 ABC transporter ATP-binding protein [candidate division WOR-3 bacterium]
MPTNEVLIKGINIRRVFVTGKERLEVLKGIDVTFKKGMIHTIVGPSGAGKSTLLHILGGLDRPTEGKVILDNSSLYDFPDRELSRIRNKKIGFIFQFHHLLPEFSALENVMMPSVIDAMNAKKARKVAENLLVKVGLSDRFDHKPNELSGGEKQRVAVARALVNNPSVIFADEPTGNLDSKNSDLLLSMLLELNRSEGITLIVVTHNKDIANKIGNVIKMKDGKIQGVENDV